ncbi:MAG: hypothetical protein U0U66_09825 [Cytophagaceae bacterium]
MKLNTFQVIAITGLVFSALAHLGLYLVDKKVENYYYLYPTWIIVFVVAYLINPFLPKDDHHH